MIPFKLLSSAITPDTKSELKLYQRDTEYSIRVNGIELMNSRMFASEKMLAELSCGDIATRKNASVLIGGLGLGYTLAAALEALHNDADVVVSELVPAVVEWNREVFGHLADYPLKDSRVTVLVDDVVDVINSRTSAFDAIMLDVDNSPDSLIQEGNGRLYTLSGLSMIQSALRPGGVLAVWSASPDTGFTKRLKMAFVHVSEKKVRGRTQNKGPLHTIWIAKK